MCEAENSVGRSKVKGVNRALLDNSIDEESDMKRKGDGDAVKTKEPRKKRGTPGPKQGKKQRKCKMNLSIYNKNKYL